MKQDQVQGQKIEYQKLGWGWPQTRWFQARNQIEERIWRQICNQIENQAWYQIRGQILDKEQNKFK